MPSKTPPQVVRQIVRLRWHHRLGPVQIAGRLGMPASTVHAVLVRCRINRLSHIDPVTRKPSGRYEHDHPGSLIHADVIKFGNIPDGGGWRYVGPQQGNRNKARTALRTGRTAMGHPIWAPPTCTSSSHCFGRYRADAYLGSGRDGRSARRRARREHRIRVEGDGGPWLQVANFDGSGPEDHHFVVGRGNGSATTVEFGDGVHGQRPSSGSSIGVRYAFRGRYSSVVLQQGRVTIDADQAEALTVVACGIDQASVLDNADPLGQRRLRVQVPSVSTDEAMWALACLPPGRTSEIRSIGDGVWVAFESGDTSRPVWLGRLATG
jgi:hypothetical protein